MRLSSAHAAAAALTAVVAAGLLAMPSRLLGPDQARLTPISLPRPASATIVVAAPPVVERPRKPAPPPAPVAQLASVVVHRSTPTPKLPVTHKRVVVRPAPTAGVTVLNRVRRHPLPADEARATTAPAPAPVPVPPAAPPAAAPTPAPATPAPPRVVAYTSTPATAASGECPKDGSPVDQAGSGKEHGHGAGGEQQAHAQGNGQGNGQGNAQGHGKK